MPVKLSRRARWAVPAAGVAVTAAVIAGLQIPSAQASPTLPARTPAQLLAAVAQGQAPALTGTVAPLAVMMAVEGLACGALNPIRATVVFETVPEHLRSRVISTMTAAGLMAAPFGGLVAGVFVGAVGLSATLLVTAGVYLAVTLWPVVSASWRDMDQG